MTDQPTPETDEFRPCLLTPSDWPAFARAMEIQRNAARADVARLRTALEGIEEYGKLCSDGDATDCERLIYLAKQALAK
jgi:hypothetical protein